ncbi:MAG: hypothetical protein Q9167_005613 [Letrouitia subvulpina]
MAQFQDCKHAFTTCVFVIYGVQCAAGFHLLTVACFRSITSSKARDKSLRSQTLQKAWIRIDIVCKLRSAIEVQIPFVPKYLPRSNPPCQVIADFHDPSLILDDPRSQRFIHYRFTREDGTIGFVVGNLSKDTIPQDEDQEVDLTDIFRYVTPQELQRYEHEDWKQEIERESNRPKLGRPRKQSRSPSQTSREAELSLDVQVSQKLRRERSRKRSLDQTGFLVANAQYPTSQPLPRRSGRPAKTKNTSSILSRVVIPLSDASHRQSGALNASPPTISSVENSFRALSSQSRALPLSTQAPLRASYSMVQTALSETESEAEGAMDSRDRSERAMSSGEQSEEKLTLIPSSNRRSLVIKGAKSKSSTTNSETEQVDVETTQFRKENIDSAVPDQSYLDPKEDPPNAGPDLLGQSQATNVRRSPSLDDSSGVLKQFQITQVKRLAQRPQSKSDNSDKPPSQLSSPASWSASNFLPNSIRNYFKPKVIPPQPQSKSPVKGSFSSLDVSAPAGASSLFASRPSKSSGSCKQEPSPPRHRNLTSSKPNSAALATTPPRQRELRRSITPHFPSAGILNKEGKVEPSYSSSLNSHGSHQIIGSVAGSPLRQRRSPVTDDLALKHKTLEQAASRALPASASMSTSTSTSASRAKSHKSERAVKEGQQAAVREKRSSSHAAASKISSESAFGSASGSSNRASSKHMPHKDRQPALREERRLDSRPASSKPDPISAPLSSASATSRKKGKDQGLRLGEWILTSKSSDDEG